jgi:hypothetical protein
VSQPYNPRVVIEKTPNALLQQFLSKFPRFADLEWKHLAENNVEPILQRVRGPDDSDRRLIAVRFRQVHSLANPSGTTVLIASCRDCGFEITDEWAAKKNAYERAFWCLVEHPEVFDSERIYAYTYALPKTARETRVGFPEGSVTVTGAMVTNLVQSIKEAYKDEQRAENCKVDHRERNGVHVFHAHPSDYIDEIDSYGPDGQLSSVSVKPPFHVVFYLDETTGGVTILAKGGGERVEELFGAFSKAVFSMPVPPKAGKKTYDLSLLKDPKFEYKTDPAHQLRKLRVTALKIHFPGQPRHKAFFEVDAHDPTDDIYDVLRVKLRGGLGELTRATILSVELQAVFGGPGGKEETVDFRISAPRWCTLGYHGKEGILRRYLRPWGIESDGKRVAALPKAARVG